MSDKVFVIGDRVQYVDNDAKFVKDGVVESIIPPKRVKPSDYWKYTQSEQDDMATYANVKWDDDSIESVNIQYLAEVDSELERDYRKIYWSNSDRIQEKLDQASQLVKEAISISEQTGIAFDTDISLVRNAYFPRSKLIKFLDLDNEFISNITNAYNDYDSIGWQHSAVC